MQTFWNIINTEINRRSEMVSTAVNIAPMIQLEGKIVVKVIAVDRYNQLSRIRIRQNWWVSFHLVSDVAEDDQAFTLA